MNENMFSYSSKKCIRNDYSALLKFLLVLSPPCTPIQYGTLHLTTHNSLLFFVDMNLQPVKIYWAVSTVTVTNGKHNVQGHTICSLYSIQPTMHCTTVYNTKRDKNQRSKHVINVLLLVFGLGQARALRRHHKQYFLSWDNGGRSLLCAVSSPDMIPHLCHHRLIPWLAADLPWCRVVYHTLSISMRRKTPQSHSGKASMEGGTRS